MSDETMKAGAVWKNKWNKKRYKIVNFAGREVTLERADNSQFMIEIIEFKRNYEPYVER